MAAIKTFFKVIGSKSAMTDKHGKTGEMVEYNWYGVKLLFEDGKTRRFFWSEITLVNMPDVEILQSEGRYHRRGDPLTDYQKVAINNL